MSEYNDHTDDKRKKRDVKYHRFTKQQEEGRQKDRLHEEIKDDIEKFIDSGGEIKKIPIIQKDVK